MKKLFLLISITAFVFASCSKEAEVARALTDTKESVENMLAFKTLDEANAMIVQLLDMSEADRADWYAKQGNFVSQEVFMWSVVEELDRAQSVEEVDKIQTKYASQYLFDPNREDRDISPYVPSSKVGYSYICNKNGDVKIGGEVVSFNDVTSFEELGKAPNPSTYVNLDNPYGRDYPKGGANNGWWTWNNEVYAKSGARRFWAQGIQLNSDKTSVIYLRLAAQKAGTFGWNSYKTSYYVGVPYWSDNWRAVADYGSIGYEILYNRSGGWTIDLSSGYMCKIGARYNPYVAAQLMLEVTNRGVAELGTKTLHIVF